MAALVALFIPLSISTATAAVVASQASPGAVLNVNISLDNDGHVTYSVTRKGRPVIEPSQLGFLLTDAPKLDRNFSVSDTATRTNDDTWEQPWGERRYVRNRYNELRVKLQEKGALKRKLDVVFRVYDDGLGFRYE